MTTNSGSFISFRNDRLGARLNAMLTAMRLSRKYGAPFKIFWALSEGSSEELKRPQDLFSRSFIREYFTEREEGSKLLKNAADIGMISSATSSEEFVRSLVAGKSYLSNSATEQLLLPWETQEDLAVLPELMESIPFNPRVTKMIARINERLSGVDFRSYHLRRGDIIDDAVLASHNLWRDKYIPRVIYEYHMKRELQRGDDTLVVFSDAAQEAAAFSALSPRVYSFTDLIGDVELSPIQRDFLELYTMSRSAQIFAPPSSAFSGLAATIGNKTVTDIQADLSPADQDAAMAELARRLEATPEVFLTQSDAGQNLPFVADYLDSKGEASRVTSIGMKWLRSGMDRAYLYPFLSERLLGEARYDECDQLIETIGERPCFREEHWSTVYGHAAMADMIRGNWDRAISRYHVSSWYYPINRIVTDMFWYLSAIGRLPQDMTWPYDPDFMRRSSKILGASDDNSAIRILVERLRNSPSESHQYPVNMEVRDWRNLHGKKLSFRFSNQAKIAQQADIVGQNIPKSKGARLWALQSAVGALMASAGRNADGEALMRQAIESRPDQPLYLKRYADFLLATGRADEGLSLMEQAWRMSGQDPCYQAEYALALQSQKQNAQYQDLMIALRESDSPIVELRVLVLEAMRRANSPREDMLAELVRLKTMAPGAHRVLALEARILEQCQEWDLALQTLRVLQQLGRPEAVLLPRFESLFKSYRRAHDEKKARKWFDREGLRHIGR